MRRRVRPRRRCPSSRKTFQSTVPNVFFGGDSALGPKNIITAVAHGHDAAISIDSLLPRREPRQPAPADGQSHQPEDGHSRVVVRQRDHNRSALQRAAGGNPNALKISAHRSRARLRPRARARRGGALPQLRRRDRVHRAGLHRMRRLRRHLSDRLHHFHCQRRRRRTCALLSTRRRKNADQAIYVAGPVKTGRIMVKDEDLCLHCGLCAERCPTGAWDMQKFILDIAQAGTRMPIKAVNDFVLRFANVNGSGSASANLMFARAILRMGVPIAPRNIFPSNIQGLPTWYEVRVCGAGWLGARGGADFVVAMNPQKLRPRHGRHRARRLSVLRFLASPCRASRLRDDIVVLGMPLTEICNTQYTDPRQRQLFKNIIYVGALGALFDIELARSRDADLRAIQGQAEADRAEHAGAAASASEARRALRLPDRPARAQAPTRSATAFSSRAISPPASARSMAARRFAPGIRSRPRPRSPRPMRATRRAIASTARPARRHFAFVQAEDEIAAIGMVVGAGWNGARAFTATSGPGISLMQEFFGLAYFAEIPAVVFDVQRGGPSTGMPTRTQQSDLLSAAFASHGDTKHVLLLPEGAARNVSSSARLAFDLAERLQTPVFVMLDLDIGMNSHLSAPFQWDDARRYDRGKVLTRRTSTPAAISAAISTSTATACPIRTLPGGHPNQRRLFHARDQPRQVRPLHRRGRPLRREHGAAAAQVGDRQARFPPPKSGRDARRQESTKVGVVYYGSTGAGDGRGAGDAQPPKASHFDAMRIRAYPFGPEVAEFLADHEPRSHRRAESRCADAHAAVDRFSNIEPKRLTRSSITAARRSPPASSSREIAQTIEGAGASRRPGGRRVTFIVKPKFHHPALETNALGLYPSRLRRRDVDALRRLRP